MTYRVYHNTLFLSKVLLQQMLHSILKALNSLHQNNYIHGNVSPKNIFVKEEGKSRIAVLGEPNFAKEEVTILICHYFRIFRSRYFNRLFHSVDNNFINTTKDVTKRRRLQSITFISISELHLDRTSQN